MVLNAQGNTRFAKNLPSRPEAFLAALTPFLPDVIVACECVHTWCGLADLCQSNPIPFIQRTSTGSDLNQIRPAVVSQQTSRVRPLRCWV